MRIDGTRPTDDTLQAAVWAILQERLGADANDIGVDVYHRIVTLVGTTPTMQERCRAESVVEHVPGVRGLANDISLPLTERPADATIAEIAVDAICREIGDGSEAVTVVVRDGRLTLVGSVRSEQERTAAERAVHFLPGVQSVSNALYIASSSS